MRTITICEGVTLTASEEVIRQYEGEKADAQWEHDALRWLREAAEAGDWVFTPTCTRTSLGSALIGKGQEKSHMALFLLAARGRRCGIIFGGRRPPSLNNRLKT